jgi:DHA1 family bicyclomycin/chloramphenicol resistance-like MFS transporter
LSASVAPTVPTSRGLIAALSMVFALAPLSMDMYLPAVPAMGRELASGTASVQLTIAIFILGMGVGQLLFGPLSDRYGRRGPIIAGVCVFIASCAACAWSANVGWLIAFRLLQGLGVCAGQVVAFAILADLHGPREFARLSSLLAIVSSVAPMIAPLLGGFVLLTWNWQAIFWTLAIYGLVVLITTIVLVPETRSAEARARSLAESPLGSYLAVLGNWPLMRLGLVCAFGTSAFATYLANAPALFIEDFGIPAQQFGWYFAVNVIGLTIASQVNRTLLQGHSPAWMLQRACAALAIFAVALALASYFARANHWPVIAALFFVVSCFPIIMANAMALAQGEDRSRAGAVAAVVGACCSGIGALAAIVSSALNNGTPLPMALTILACAVIALLLQRLASASTRSAVAAREALSSE